MCKVSILIPTYNSEKYIEECISSVQKQTLRDIEIICIDDGSNDNTIDIVSRIKETDSRIILYLNKHNGPGMARNTGMKYAKGEYIAFLDSDDIYLETNALEKLYICAKKNRIRVCGSLPQIQIAGEWEPTPQLENVYGEIPAEGLKLRFRDKQCVYGFTGFIIQRGIINDSKIQFLDLYRFEDPIFLFELLDYVDEYFLIPSKLYGIRKGHHTNDHRVLNILDELKGISILLEIANEKKYGRVFSLVIEHIEILMNNIIENNSLEIVEQLCHIEKIISKSEYADGYSVMNKLLKWTAIGYEMTEAPHMPYSMRKLYKRISGKEKILEEYFNEKKIKDVLLYGLGAYGQGVFTFLRALNVNIEGGIDKRVSYFEGIKVYKPEEDLPECDAIIVTPVDSEDICAMLHAKGLNNYLKWSNIEQEIRKILKINNS